MSPLKTFLHAFGWRAGSDLAKEAVQRAFVSVDEERRREREARARRARLVTLVVGCSVGLVLLVAVMKKLLVWGVAACLLGGIAYGAYVLARPSVAALLTARSERRSRALAAGADAARKKQLEAELATLKNKA